MNLILIQGTLSDRFYPLYRLKFKLLSQKCMKFSKFHGRLLSSNPTVGVEMLEEADPTTDTIRSYNRLISGLNSSKLIPQE